MKTAKRLYEKSYRKIPKISPGAYIFQRPFSRGLHSEGFIYGEKFAFQNRLGVGYKAIEATSQAACFALL